MLSIRFMGLFFLAQGILFLFFPLLRHLHLESAIVVSISTSIFFSILNRKSIVRHPLFYTLIPLLTAVPLLISDLLKGCFTHEGFFFWILIPPTSALLILSIRALTQRFLKKERFITFIVLFLLAVIIPAIEWLQTPTVYFYNSIWGYFPGPIYDQDIEFPLSLIIHRLFWLVVAFLFFELGKRTASIKKVILSFLAIILIGIQFRSFGISRYNKDVAQFFSEIHQSKRTIIYFNDSLTEKKEVEAWGKWIDFHIQDLEQMLKLTVSKPILIFFYNDPWEKKEIVGAKYTQYTPVWVNQPQVHVDKSSFEQVIRHELAHVLLREWNKSPLRAPLNLALVEGMATALDPEIHPHKTLHEFVAADSNKSEKELLNLISLSGFYSQNSSIGYLKSGSLMLYLIQKDSLQLLKDAYTEWLPSDDIRFRIEQNLPSYFDFLTAIEVDDSTKESAKQLFSRPSLFQKDCPRSFTDEYRFWDLSNKHQQRGDTSNYKKALKSGLEIADSLWLPYFKERYVQTLMESREYDLVVNTLQKDTTLTMLFTLYDAAFLDNDTTEVNEVINRIELKSLSNKHPFYINRSDSFLSHFYAFKYDMMDSSIVSSIPNRYKIWALEKFLEKGQTDSIIRVLSSLETSHITPNSTPLILKSIRHLILNNQIEVGKQELQKLDLQISNPEHRRRLHQIYKLLQYLN